MTRTDMQPGGGEPRATSNRRAAAERQRQRRRRERDGLIVLPVEVPEHELVEALIATGRLSEVSALDRSKLAEASKAIVMDWLRKFRHA